MNIDLRCGNSLEVLEGFNFVGIDLDPAYVEIAKARIEAANETKS